MDKDKLVKMNTPLYHMDKNGGLRIWGVTVVDDNIITQYGVVGGKMQIASKKATPKNVGTKAETTGHEQAIKEAESMHKYRLKRKYSTTPDKARLPSELPMLAHKYAEKPHKVVWPCGLQRKLNGLRCTARCEDGEVTLYSRAGLVLNVPHICEELSWMDDSVILDGELYVHGVPLQTINSWIPKPGQSMKEETSQIEYHLYDAPYSDTVTWLFRHRYLNKIKESEHVKVEETYQVSNEEEAYAMVDAFLGEGYEGGMLRNWDGLYDWGHRSSDLLKIKKFDDEEFEVVGYQEGKGKDKGKVTWICLNNDGTDETFKARPRGTMEERAEWFKNGDDYLGKLLTVRFHGRTNKNIPFIPVGIVFRIEEDLPQ